MDIIQSENYEELGAELQFQMIKILNETLKKYKVSEEIRKDICGDFTFDFSMLIDQGEINDMIPGICFSTKDEIFIKNDEFEFHEYAFGNVDELFESE